MNQKKSKQPATDSLPAKSNADYEIVIRRFVTATIEAPPEPLVLLLGGADEKLRGRRAARI